MVLCGWVVERNKPGGITPPVFIGCLSECREGPPRLQSRSDYHSGRTTYEHREEWWVDRVPVGGLTRASERERERERERVSD